MVLEGRLKGSLVVVLTVFFSIKGDLSLNFFGHVLLLLATKFAKTPLYILHYLFIPWFQLCLLSCVHAFTFFYLVFFFYLDLLKIYLASSGELKMSILCYLSLAQTHCQSMRLLHKLYSVWTRPSLFGGESPSISIDV